MDKWFVCNISYWYLILNINNIIYIDIIIKQFFYIAFLIYNKKNSKQEAKLAKATIVTSVSIVY